MGVFAISVIGLVFYCSVNGDLNRIIHGYDNCANVCGVKNTPEKDPRFACKGADHTTRPFLLIREAGRAVINPINVRRECVSNCTNYSGFREFLNRCIPLPSSETIDSFFSKTGLADFLHEASEDLHLCWREIVYLGLIAFAFSIILFLLFRFFIGFVIWLVLIGVVIASVGGAFFLWLLWKSARDELKEKNDESVLGRRTVNTYLVYAILATVSAVVIVLVVLIMRKRIALVAQLFKEAGKALNSMPLLLVQPIITFVALAAVVIVWFYFTLLIQSAGYINVRGNENLYYKKDFAMKFSRWYNLLGLFWFSQFVIGCQHMIVAGAVSKWFFTRNKDDLGVPICRSACNLVTYHLGTVALGSFLIAIVQLIRSILATVQKTLRGTKNKCLESVASGCQCCLYCFEKILKYLSRNAYIETAMYGMPFCRAGQQAFKQLTNNALRVAAINSVGDFVLFLGKALIVTATVLIGIEMLKGKEGVLHIWIPLSVAGVFAYLVSHCFITIYEMVIDTIFLCFCEDCELNDGISKPYFMSRGLLEFVENSKKALAITNDK
ncbi:UNVERIFIED_CONTAM: hypothetical protein PYX00_009211 [Menopon gallinae]